MSTSVAPRSASANSHPTRQQLDELDSLLQRMLELPVNSVEEEPARVRPTPEKPPESPRSSVPEPDTSRLEPRKLAEPSRAANDTNEPEEDPETWVPLRSSWQPSAQTWGPLAKKWQEAQQTDIPPAEDVPFKYPSAPREDKAEAGSGPHMRLAALERLASASDTDAGRHESVPQREPEPGRSPLPTSWQVDAHAASEPFDSVSAMKGLVRPLSPAERSKPKEVAPSAHEAPAPFWLWPFIAIDTTFDLCLSLFGPLSRPLRSRAGKSVLGALGLLALAGAAALAAIDWFGWTW